MRVIALSSLKRFWEGKHADAREPLLAWYRHALKADWHAPADVKRDFGTASILRDGRVVNEERHLDELRERIRDVVQGPDGYLYLVTDSPSGRILRVVPAAP